jgi:hypothetical protein
VPLPPPLSLSSPPPTFLSSGAGQGDDGPGEHGRGEMAKPSGAHHGFTVGTLPPPLPRSVNSGSLRPLISSALDMSYLDP